MFEWAPDDRRNSVHVGLALDKGELSMQTIGIGAGLRGGLHGTKLGLVLFVDLESLLPWLNPSHQKSIRKANFGPSVVAVWMEE